MRPHFLNMLKMEMDCIHSYRSSSVAEGFQFIAQGNFDLQPGEAVDEPDSNLLNPRPLLYLLSHYWPPKCAANITHFMPSNVNRQTAKTTAYYRTASIISNK